MLKIINLAVFLCAFLTGTLEAQTLSTSEAGMFYSRYFSPKEYKANPQNWSALQKDNGVMVFGNGDGVMSFDGASWQLVPMSNNNLVRCLSVGPDKKLYAGGYNEIGYISENGFGRPEYVSLTDKLNEGQREFGHVWNILFFRNRIYFTTDKGLLVFDGHSVRHVTLPYEEDRMFTTVYEGKILVQPAGQSLFIFDNEEEIALPGGEFYRGKRITGILPYDSNNDLICTLDDGLYLYDGKGSKPFTSEATSFLAENRLYKALLLSSGHYAFGTLNHGVVIINKNGKLEHVIEKGKGLGDNAVYNLFEDRQGALWVCMSVGISRVELQTPITWFDERNGLSGAVNDIIRYNDKLYAATMLGFYELMPASSPEVRAHFRQVKEISSSVWAMTARHGSLLLVTDNGTAELKNGKYQYIDDYSGAVILPSGHDPDLVYVGLTDGVVVLHFRNGEWKSMGHIPDVEADVGEMNEDADGNLWLGTFSEGVIRIQFPSENGKPNYLKPSVTKFEEKNGLPVGYVQIHRVGDQLIFRVEPNHELYFYNAKANRFDPFSFKDTFPQSDSTLTYPFANERKGQTWMINRKKDRPSFDFLLYSESQNKVEKKVISFSRVQEDTDEAIFIDPDGIAWLGGLDGIVRLDYKSTERARPAFQAIVNEIKVGNDSIIYSGTDAPPSNLNFSHPNNTLKFSFGAPSFDLSAENEYQFLLEGFDDDWSGWTKEMSKSYTKIREGNYVFRVKARNIYGDISSETSVAFTVEPPWYRHIGAYFVYALIAFGSVYLIVKVKSRQLEKEKAALEKVVADRTVEILNKNLQLEQQAEELRTQTEQLKEMDKVKSNFFTNISHEFRTPLSLILAPLEKELSDPAKRPETEMMYRNARRLQNLINQLLDLSKLESGQMKVYLCRNDLTSFIKMVLSAFYPLAESRNIRFETSIPEGSHDTYFDAEKLETILYNVLSNAFKFTHENGEVFFSMKPVGNNDQVEFIVKDTGEGIPEEGIRRIFDRFYQVDSGVQREFEGSGIGLALVKELVYLMDGEISVDSRVGVGSIFRIVLPFAKAGHETLPAEIASIDNPMPDPREIDFDLADESHSTERPTILLVEDNEDMSTYLSGVLEKTYDVVIAFNGEEALAATEKLIPDLILSDMMMPRMDGFTLCEKIRKAEATSHVPFLLLTARSTVESRLAGLELGADDYLTKPFLVAELQIRIKNLLQQRANLKKRFRQELKVAPKEVTVTSMDERFLRTVMEAVEQNIGDSNFSVERLSEVVGMSRKNLHRKLVALVDQTPNEFIRLFRLKLALQLLEQQSGNVKEVAFSVGFNNLSYFAKCFKEQFGISPTEVKVQAKLPALE